MKKLFIAPIVVAVAVITIAAAAKVIPIRYATGSANIAHGDPSSPNTAATASTAAPDISARVAPHITSPITMSSGPNGVNRMDS